MAYKKRRMSLGKFLITLLEDNERLFRQGKKPRTDEEILRILMKSFPNSDGIKSMLLGKQSVNKYRNMIAKGQYFRHNPPRPLPYFRYNDRGQRVSGKSGKKVLTLLEQKKIISKHVDFVAKYADQHGVYFDKQKTKELAIL